MQLNIASEHVVRIVDIMEEYILEEVKQSSNFEEVNALCTFYRKLKEAATDVDENKQYVTIAVDEAVQLSVPKVIENRIQDIVKDADNLDLISEITELYNSLKVGASSSTNNFKNNTDKKGNNTKKNSGGKSEDDRVSQMDVKEAQYAGENTQNASEKSEQSSDSKPQAAGTAGTAGSNNTSNTGKVTGVNSNSGGTESNTNVTNPQWSYDDEALDSDGLF